MRVYCVRVLFVPSCHLPLAAIPFCTRKSLPKKEAGDVSPRQACWQMDAMRSLLYARDV
ncbi:unnamed protein product [Scytosiphon promiscuus]